MRARFSSIAEMKANRCERPGCQFAPVYQVFDINSEGSHESVYLCENHYADLKQQQIKATEKKFCELCGNPDTKLIPSPQFGDANPNRVYQVCAGCKSEQEALMEDEFAGEDVTDDQIDIDERKNLDDTKYDEF